ncbi:uncharacterized protein DUF695 [Acinetobacter calcoaceticus]|uniref:Uncharacterized protein DUF695 n=1 Tax=Acinetobacter calcoaceticus TaxID=471 RepID=A0A4R1XVR0_ACICA|nr:uncharacterized protein DUF695 [Acinetobacter calcoaceticus]
MNTVTTDLTLKLINEAEALYQEFWQWFINRAVQFQPDHWVQDQVETFSLELRTVVNRIHSGIGFRIETMQDGVKQLCFSCQGNIANIVMIESLVDAAPEISGWEILAFQPAVDLNMIDLTISGYSFNQHQLQYAFKFDPDQAHFIDLHIIHPDYVTAQHDVFMDAISIYLEQLLGELDKLSLIDHYSICAQPEFDSSSKPIQYLQQELADLLQQQAYLDDLYATDAEDDEYQVLEAITEDGHLLTALMNSHLLHWDKKPSHPWLMVIEIAYAGNESHFMPSQRDFLALNQLENELELQLHYEQGYVNIGHETGSNLRSIFFASKDFRKPVQVINALKSKYQPQFEIDVRIFKDKYWQSLDDYMLG